MNRSCIAGVAAVVAIGAMSFFSHSAPAQQPNLEGSWSGTGRVTFPSGASESARCRVSFQKRGGDQFAMNAVCASTTGRVSQTASLSRVSASKFSGEFHNAEYGVSGSINVTLRGNSLIASLDGGGATASLALSR